MKTNHLTFVVSLAALAAFATALHGQTAQPAPATDQSPLLPPIPPPPPAPAPYVPPSYGIPSGYYGFSNPNQSPALAGSITIPYAFNWRATGVSAELGGLLNNGFFLGGEVGYYNGDPVRYDVYHGSTYLGHFDSSLELTTLDLAARYFVPIWSVNSQSRLSFYIGASGGVGFVDYSNDGGFFGFHTYDNGNWTGEVLAGFQFDVAPRTAIRIGYRYIGVSDTWLFDHQTNLQSSVLEAGVACRF